MKVWVAVVTSLLVSCAPAPRVLRCRVDRECEGAAGAAASCSSEGLCVWEDGGVVYPGVLIITVDELPIDAAPERDAR